MDAGIIKFITYWGGMAFFLLLELFFSYRQPSISKLSRWLTNLPLALFNGTIYAVLYAKAIENQLANTAATSSGLLHMAPLPPVTKVIAGILILDCSIYLWHVANHVVPVLWRFHRVHHSDMNMDVSTANRFHLGEFLLSGLIRLALIVLCGIPALSYLIFELLANLAVQFHHSSIRLPSWFENQWIRLFVPPSMHRVHHSVKILERDSNYGVVFSFWDRLFSTLRQDVAQEGIIIGIGSHRNLAHLGFIDLLRMPFTPPSR